MGKVSSGTIAVRFYMLASTSPANSTTFIWLQKSTETAENVLFSSYGNWGGEALGGSIGTQTSVTSNVGITANRWLCVEWVIDVAKAGRQQLFVDSNPVPVFTKDLDTIGDTTKGYELVSIYMNNQTETQQLVFDDVAIAILPARAEGQRIGCFP